MTAMNAVDLVALLALLQLFVFGALVGRARGKFGVKAPAIVGHEGFERAYRVQMNTIELMVLLVPALFLAAKHWAPMYAAIAGAVYLLGRVLYWQAYMRARSAEASVFRSASGPSW
jgi:glutathione S-transferase